MPRFPVVLLAVRFLAGSPLSRRGRGRLVGAVIAVAVSLVPLVVVQQVADGMILGIVERFIETGSYHVQAASRPGAGGVLHESFPDKLAEIRMVPGVRGALAERQGFGLVYSSRGRSGVTLRAVPQSFWDDDPGVQAYMEVVSGSFELSSEDSIILGIEIASRLQVGEGDEVRVLTVRPLGEGRMIPRVSRFTVRGVVSTGYRDLDRLWSFVPRERGMRIIPDETARDLVGVKVDAPLALENPLFQRGINALVHGRDQRRMEEALTAVRGVLGPEWVVYNWYSAERNRYVSFLTSRNLIAFVMSLIVAVAAVNISSALVLLVIEKEEEIAILRATGAARLQVGAIFLACGAVIGAGGALLGIVLGALLAVNINEVLRGLEILAGFLSGQHVSLFDADFYLENVPVELGLVPLVLAVFLALSLAILAAVIPARRAASVSPDRILRRHG
ncbi:MAG: ABC transporter permease [Spirochaetaceae bacterium]|nr:MAG: ABC transporter permease [Spirochaetaceae bacterium]